MNDRHTITNQESPASRSEIEADILQQIRSEVQEAIAHHAPAKWSQEKRNAVEESVLDHSQMVMDALSTSELHSEGALRTHIRQAVAEVKRLILQGGVRS